MLYLQVALEKGFRQNYIEGFNGTDKGIKVIDKGSDVILRARDEAVMVLQLNDDGDLTKVHSTKIEMSLGQHTHTADNNHVFLRACYVQTADDKRSAEIDMIFSYEKDANGKIHRVNILEHPILSYYVNEENFFPKEIDVVNFAKSYLSQ